MVEGLAPHKPRLPSPARVCTSYALCPGCCPHPCMWLELLLHTNLSSGVTPHMLLSRQNKITTSHSPSRTLVLPGVYPLFFSFASRPVATYLHPSHHRPSISAMYPSNLSICPLISLSLVSVCLSVCPWERLLLCGSLQHPRSSSCLPHGRFSGIVC